MSSVEEHAQSIAATAADYRQDELAPFDQAHVVTWVEQFDEADRLPMLAELDHVLKRTYFSGATVDKFLGGLIDESPDLTGDNPVEFWKNAGVLNIQQAGSSQTEILQRFRPILQEKIGLDLDECQATSGNFLYLDDAVFTGNPCVTRSPVVG